MADKRKRPTGSSKQNKSGGIIVSVVEQTTRLAGETTRIAGEMLDSAGNVATTARATGADWVKGVSPTAAEMLRPGSKKKAASGRAARQPRKTVVGKATAGAAGTARKTTKSAGKATAQATTAASRATKQVARSVKQTARSARTSAKGSKKK